MVGYNHRATLVKFYDDDQGYGVSEFRSNKHLRVPMLHFRFDIQYFFPYPSLNKVKGASLKLFSDVPSLKISINFSMHNRFFFKFIKKIITKYPGSWKFK